LPPRFRAGQINFGFRLRIRRAGATSRAHRDDDIVHGLRAATVFDHVDLSFLCRGFG